jgi:SAM-dependent methyltransferase
MHEHLLDVLTDPVDGSSLALAAAGPRAGDGDGSQIASGELAGANGRRYEIRDGVPRMVPRDDSSVNADDGATQRSFGAKWDQYDEPDKEKLAEFQYHWFDARFGFGGETGLAEFLAPARWILDAGTGPGLCAARCAQLSDARVAGMDLSESVTAAQRTYGERANLDYVQGDILNPPFARRAFDLVVADQVLHHTPDCVRGFHAMAELVAPGGQLAVYVYRRKPIIRELVDDHVIDLTARLSFDECLELSEQLTELGRELSRLGAKVKLERGVPLLGIEPGEHDVQRLIYWTMLKCFWNEELGWHQSVMVNYDWYSPVFRSRHTEEEVLGWCADAGLEVVHLDVIESGISVRARRPDVA